MLDLNDTLAMEEFGMMFDQLGSGEKDWVLNEIAKMEESYFTPTPGGDVKEV